MTALSNLVEAAFALAQLNASITQSNELIHQGEQQKLTQTRESVKSPTTTTFDKKESFPKRLMQILNDRSVSEIISWLPHGQSFVILRPDVFTDRVMSKYFPSVASRGSSSKYPSFTRKLNRWGFRQATRGPNTGAFSHPLFRRDQPGLCLEMVCQRSRDPVAKVPRNKKAADEPVPLTKDTADTTMLHDLYIPSSKKVSSTVSVSDDCRSETSSSQSSTGACMPPPATIQMLRPCVISSDPHLVKETLRKRDEMERYQTARAMLYESFMQALRGK